MTCAIIFVITMPLILNVIAQIKASILRCQTCIKETLMAPMAFFYRFINFHNSPMQNLTSLDETPASMSSPPASSLGMFPSELGLQLFVSVIIGIVFLKLLHRYFEEAKALLHACRKHFRQDAAACSVAQSVDAFGLGDGVLSLGTIE